MFVDAQNAADDDAVLLVSRTIIFLLKDTMSSKRALYLGKERFVRPAVAEKKSVESVCRRFGSVRWYCLFKP
jgi:hypothetical protein